MLVLIASLLKLALRIEVMRVVRLKSLGVLVIILVGIILKCTDKKS